MDCDDHVCMIGGSKELAWLLPDEMSDDKTHKGWLSIQPFLYARTCTYRKILGGIENEG